MMVETESETSKILLVDDDLKFCRLTADYLGRFGFAVSLANDGQEALARLEKDGFDAVVLDVMMPGMDGFEVLKRIRDRCDTPVLMLTALGDETDRIVGLEIGADDYLPKTFSPRELLARLRAVLRRAQRPEGRRVEAEPGKSGRDELIVGALVFDLAARLVYLEGETLSLTPVEYDLLLVLAQSKGRIKSREQLLNEIRDRNYDIFDRSIDVHISALRKKLGDPPQNPRFIRTVRSAGYMLLAQDAV
ncbi:MAG: response regulator transcription factor [Candidatus Obscuribacter phosphatis]|uniref:Response regulator transcription factor n=1 Tax=Candidatus Obscuribacter phosphatis TaxID=1906157 RepID=A0A8J7PDY7_9BACT|nr:response regulator transcription factor [Candidatus Obscuribacter phosphatis]